MRKRRAGFAIRCHEREYSSPRSFYDRSLEEFWFEFLTFPSDSELRILDAIVQNCESLDVAGKAILMSSFDPRLASEDRPYSL